MNDTHPEAARIQLELLRAAGATKRAELALSLSQTVIGLSRRALRAQMPGASEQEVLLRWVEQNYGMALGHALRSHLEKRGV